MIEIFLKHKIYEYCINLIFKLLNQNFNNNSSFPRVGDVYSEVIIEGRPFLKEGHKRSLRDCLVTYVKEYNAFGEKIHNVGVRPNGSDDSLLVYTHNTQFIK